jgi:hypothetical protein
MSHKRFIVTVNPGADLKTVAADLKTHGFTVDNILQEVGVISASTDADDLASVQSLQGVLAVEEDQEVQLPPPEAPLQ